MVYVARTRRRIRTGENEFRDGFQLSVTYNFKFGGTQVGWIGEMSVPVTSASGNSSAKSLHGG